MEYVILDLETTGLDCRTDSIIEIGAVRIVNGVICEEFTALVDPARKLPRQITRLTGITDLMLEDQPCLDEVLPRLMEFLGEAVLVAHNAGFDKSFLQPSLKRPFQWLDTLELARILLPGAKGYSLHDLTRSLDIVHEEAHRALGDAKAAAQLFLSLLDLLKQIDFVVLQTLERLTGKQTDALAQLIQKEYALRCHRFPDDKIRTLRLFQPHHEKKGLFTEQVLYEKNPEYQIPRDELGKYFKPGGAFCLQDASYEYREQQETMAAAVAESFSQKNNLIVEAGTGTGKSLAYLIPAAFWSIKSGEKVIISTHTINLQEQLLIKDIPLVKEILDCEIAAAVVKGRSHYLCMRKWESLMEQNGLEWNRFMMRLVLWLHRTKTGETGELSLFGKEAAAGWRRVAGLKETCLGVKCKYFRNQCFITRARKKAEAAQLVIVNHSLLLANAMANNSILPEYRYLIIDEAHQLEKVAEEQFAALISYPDLSQLLSRILKNGAGAAGVIDTLKTKVPKWGLSDDAGKDLLEQANGVVDVIHQCDKTGEEFFSILGIYFKQEMIPGSIYANTLRILPKHRNSASWSAVASAGDNFKIKLKNLVDHLVVLGEVLSNYDQEYGLELTLPGEINLIAGELFELAKSLADFLQEKDDDQVCWMEFFPESVYPVLHIAPVEVKEHLAHYLFENKASAVLTSATLTVDHQFNYFKENIGIELAGHPLVSLQLPSPFNYRENVFFGIVNDLPDPGNASELLFTEAVAGAVIKLVIASRGRSLVLFTSHYQLRQVYERVRQPLEDAGIVVHAHAITGSRSRLLEQFKTGERSVILGANSFWEGIDVMGEALSSVIIVKLPFWPPSIPTVSARLDRYKKQGKDGFRQYSLPQAIIRFKQGFGRLIRSQRDSGVICILDRRINEKRYGKTFIKSLPDVFVQTASLDEMVPAVDAWFSRDEETDTI